MWIMIVMTTYFSAGGSSSAADARVAPSIIGVEFTSRDRCIKAAEFTKKQPKVYNAFCIQK